MQPDFEKMLLQKIQRRGAEAGREPAEPRDLSNDENALTHAVIGAAMDVHRQLGPGFLESVYEQALDVELTARGIAFRRQVPFSIFYKGQLVGESRLDLLVENRLVLELKAVSSLEAIHGAQLLSYLKAGNYRMGLLINFNARLLRQGLRRVVLTALASAASPQASAPLR